MKSLFLLALCQLTLACFTHYSSAAQCYSFLNPPLRSESALKNEILEMLSRNYSQQEMANQLGISLPRVAYLEAIVVVESGKLLMNRPFLVRREREVTRSVPSWARLRRGGRIQTQEYDLRRQMVIDALDAYGDLTPLFNFSNTPESARRLHTPSQSGLGWLSSYIGRKKKSTGYIHLYNLLSKSTFKFWQRANDLPEHIFEPSKEKALRAQRAADFYALEIQMRIENLPPPEVLVKKYDALRRALAVEQNAVAELGLIYERLVENSFSVPRPDAEIDPATLPKVVADYVTQRARWITLQQDALFDSGAIPRED